MQPTQNLADAKGMCILQQASPPKKQKSGGWSAWDHMKSESLSCTPWVSSEILSETTPTADRPTAHSANSLKVPDSKFT